MDYKTYLTPNLLGAPCGG